MPKTAPLLALALSLTLPLNALAAGVEPCAPPDASMLSERDTERLDGLEWSRLRGLAAAMTAEDAEARQTLGGLYSNGLAPVGELNEGDYHCRTIKMGGISPLIVYQFFDCAIEASVDGYVIAKPTGSQRFEGELIRSGDGYFYRGALYYSDEGPMDYTGESERDQVGCLYQISEDGAGYVLELPSPQFESFHDVIVLLPKLE